MEIKAILSEALRCIERARSIKPSSEIEVSALRWETYATLQNILDALSMSIVELNLKKPSSYSELGFVLYENGLIDINIAEIIRRIAIVRNILAHAYRRISMEDLKKIINELFPDIEKVVNSLYRIIEEKAIDPEKQSFKLTEPMLSKIAEVFKEHNVTIAYLFGSRARGDFREDSDYDIAVLFKKEDVNILDEVEITIKIADTLKIPADKINVVSLNNAEPTLIARILKEGKIIYQCNEKSRKNWERKTYLELLRNTDLYAIYLKKTLKK